MATTVKTEVKVTLPPHLQIIADKINASAIKFSFKITDVTPKGYGPTE